MLTGYRNEAEELAAEYGFYRTTTGGGCTALQFEEDDTEMLITVVGTADAPTKLNEPVTLSMSGCDTPIGDFATLREALEHANA